MILIGSDHAGYELKEYLKKRITGYEIKDFGAFSYDAVDYPDIIHPLANSISKNNGNIGIIICGSGNGASMCANEPRPKNVVVSTQHA